MSKFVVVKEAPAELKKGEYLIDKPTFIEQVTQHKAKAPRNGLTGSHYLRALTEAVASAYDPQNMSAYSIKAHLYEGRKFETLEDVNNILIEALRNDYPAVFAKYLDVKIKARPSKTDLVIYVNSDIQGQYEIFYQNGLSEQEAPAKAKSEKVVGKPAITKEQAEAQKNQADS